MDFATFRQIFQTNKDLEKNGVVQSFGSAGRICIARAGGANTAYTKLLEAKTRPYRRQLQNEMLEEEFIRRILIDVYVETVILWVEEGPEDAARRWTKDEIRQFCIDIPDFFTDIQEQAQKSKNYRIEEAEEAVKNS